MNIAITNVCNRRCPFCYQSKIMENAKNSGGTEISLENFLHVIDFIIKSGEHKLHMVGGEPTLHRSFAEIVRIVGENPFIHQVILFTNGEFKPSTIEPIIKYSNKFVISINVPEPRYETGSRLKRLHNNLQHLSLNGVPFDLSYVVSTPDFDMSFLLDYTEKYGIKSLRWALAFPVVERAHHIVKEELKNIGRKVVSSLRMLNARGIKTYVDCPLPYCIFSDEDMGFLSRESLSVVNWGYCGLTLEVNPDLTIKACPVQREQERVPLSFFRNMQEMERFFFAKMSVYKANHILFEECRDCRYYLNNRCQGGCLGYSKDKYEGMQESGISALCSTLLSRDPHIRKLPFLKVREDRGMHQIYSSVSQQVKSETIDGICLRLWNELSSEPKLSSILKGKSMEEKNAALFFIERLQRIGFVDLYLIDRN
ncbi:MAG: radical SAM protein [wastewater metagenome]|nr:radical SAM protein [Candidatus Loosdrechtia aerotolerans]